MKDEIVIKGAKTHNLKNINISIPKNKFCVITGLSGSGKSSLAFDTIYAAGQRKYVESLSAYARQFLQLMDKPDVDHIEGLSPAISIEQKSTSHNPRSTVGTITEIHDYLRLLYARIGTAKCPTHHRPLKAQTISQITSTVLDLPLDSKIMILAPIVRNRKGEYKTLLDNYAREGYMRARIDGDNYDLQDPPSLDLHKKHNIEIIIDRLKIKNDDSCRIRIADSIETAIKISNGLVYIASMDNSFTDIIFSTKYSCIDCNYNIAELEPHNFSFNNPNGACPTCMGLGIKEIFTPNAFICNDHLSLKQGAITGWTPSQSFSFSMIEALAKHYNFSLDTPFRDLPDNITNIIFYGNNGEEIEYSSEFGKTSFKKKDCFLGIIPIVNKRYLETSDQHKDEYTKFLTKLTCPDCNGKRLKTEYQNVFVNDISLPDLGEQTIKENLDFFEKLSLTDTEHHIAKRILQEIKERLNFLVNVGLDYLTLNRSAETLSGGETQRIRLASQIGSGLTGVMYVLDEPSIGLHQKDNTKLLEALNHLRDLGNTLIVVEHDEETIESADFIIDIGPKAGIHGGSIVATGSPEDIKTNPNSLTGLYLSKQKFISIPARKKCTNKFLELKGASGHNLKNIDISIPCELFTCITGVSGSGKSTLINETLYKIAQHELNGSRQSTPEPYKEIIGLENFDKVINVDQSPIGKTPRSNCATYVEVFTTIRELFSQTQESRARGYTAGRFSFNVKGGRCEACSGDGLKKIEMNFLPTVYVQCEECKGKRYNKETLDITYKGKNIDDILSMSVEEAYVFFEAIPSIKNKLKTLIDVGLSYIQLGQSATTFSGGEAQRIKLAKELSKKSTGRTLYILDEPTTGLHFEDIQMLLSVLFKLRDAGNTIIVIEHNLDVIKSADYIIDLGPDGGYKGGQVIAKGTPEEVTKVKKSYTGQYLAKILTYNKK